MSAALFFSLAGRTRRLHWWAGVFVLSLVTAIAQAAASLFLHRLWLDGADSARAMADTYNVGAWYSVGLMLLFAWPYYALSIKRRHDRGSAGVDVTILIALVVLMQLWSATRLGFSPLEIPAESTEGASAFLMWLPQPPVAYHAARWMLGLYALYVIVVLGFAPGTPGPNRYGDVPTVASTT